ncbi:MAG: aldehyde dehydrogenase family protein [Bacteroidetes bacterium]|nr:aldehyde dehydrogenase family protein [Bacteroidota bacterium]
MQDFLKTLGLEAENSGVSTGLNWLPVDKTRQTAIHSPVDGSLIGKLNKGGAAEYDQVLATAEKAFQTWRLIPAPKRGEIVRQIGNVLRENKRPLGQLVSYEMGKSLQEGMGEVQEMIDICDFAVGLSRQLYGLTIASERPNHRMMETWQPLGIVGVITSFNFPVAVWAWNAMLAAVCGDVVIWKPSHKTPLSAVATQKLLAGVLKENQVPEGVFSLITGDTRDISERLTLDHRVPLISATGSTRMGKLVGRACADRFARTILELGGNNAIILSQEADLKLALPAIVFGAVGTAGQRCTTTRRLIVHDSIYDSVREKLVTAYSSLKIGNPLDEKNHVGPLIDLDAVKTMQAALVSLKNQGGKVIFGGDVLSGPGYETGTYVRPAICEAENSYPIVQEETFAPILYLIRYKSIEEAIALQNGVQQGLSSAIFTNNMREMEKFLSPAGSDCGIANVNIGTSGAEIGGAFGGEKETGGGRESGSDSWKIYMRRQTVTVNYGTTIPLAQGIKFDL